MSLTRIFAGLLLSASCAPAIAAALDEVTELTPLATAKQTAGQNVTCVANDALNGVTFSWCIEKGATYDRSKVLWYFHTNGGNEHQLIDSGWYAAIRQMWKAGKVLPPVVIAVSFGPKWQLSDVPSTFVAGAPVLNDFVASALMPYLESKIGPTTPKVVGTAGSTVAKRMLMGSSMGGYNAGLFLERHPALFKKAVFGCPGFFTVTPFSGAAEIGAYVARTGALTDWVIAGLQLLGHDELNLDPEAWERNDPLAQVTSLSSSSPPVFVWYNDRDQFGLAEGAAEFASSAALLGVQVPEPSHNAGGHCAIDTVTEERIAAFLQ